MLSATVERFGGEATTRHRVRDLSPGGVRIDAPETLMAGATVLISVGALEAVAATVRWISGGFAGLAFVKQIDPEQARTRTAIAPHPTAKPRILRTPSTPAAGWVANLRSPYGT